MQRLMVIFWLVSNLMVVSVAQSDNTNLVLEYDRIFSAIVDLDNTIEVRLFNDGLVTVHKPVFTRPAGDFSFKMSEAEMKQLLEHLDGFNLDRFDGLSVQLEIEQIQTDLQRQGVESKVFRYISDPEAIRVRTHKNDISPLSSHLFSYSGPQRDVLLYPQVDQLDELQNIREILDEIAVDPRLQAVGIN